MSVPGITLSRHIIEEEHRFPSATGEFSSLLQQISYAGRVLAHTIGRASIDGLAGSTGVVGPTGDVQKRLDMLADEIMRDAFTRSKLVAGIASEEHEDPAELNVSAEANYLLCLDPLDGSGNTGNNASMGTIFGIFRRRDTDRPVDHRDFLRAGRELVAAGYLLYGPSTMLVYTAGEGVHGFTLDRSVGEFLLTHPNVTCPSTGRVLAVNTSRTAEWPSHARSYVQKLTDANDGFMVRYSGAPIADFHRCLIEGGVFIYPPDADYPAGKLSILYEAAPLAFIAEQAGGAASNGTDRIVDIVPTSLHEPAPIIIGSAQLVADYDDFTSSG